MGDEGKNKINESDNNKFYRNLSILLKLFKNRPNHLAKYLIENSAFTEEFIYNIIDSEKLNEMTPNDTFNYFSEVNDLTPVYFSDFKEMDDFYLNIMEEKLMLVDTTELTIELNNKLKGYISEDRFEDAVRIRDYMKRNNLSINI